MTLGKILDYSQARPPLGKVKANGYAAVYRYVCSDASERGLPGKRLTPAERDQILGAGLDLGLHGEDDSGAAKLGYTRGKQQGAQWADYASSVLQAPKGMTIVAAIDYNTLGVYPPVVSDYLHGVTDGMAGEYKTGAYGSIYVVDAALAEKTAVHGVQTNAWSDGKVSTWAHLYQHGGTEFPGTDFNDVLRRPHGTWLQTITPEVDLTQEEHDALMAVAAALTPLSAKGDFQIAAGQSSVGGTLSAILPAVQGLFTQENANTAAVKAALTAALQATEKDIETAVQGIVAAGGDPAAVAKAVIGLLAAKVSAP